MLAGTAPAAQADATEDFFRAVEFDNVNGVRHLLRSGMNPNVTEKYRGNTGLIVALFEGSMNVFDVLVDAPNIDVNARANNGNSALMIAAYKGNQTAVQVLLKKGAAINQPGWTPLHYAAAGGKDDIVRLLLDKGAEIDARSPNHTTPLMIAAYEGHYSTAKLLLDRGADVTLTNVSGLTTIDYAKHFDRRDIIELLASSLKTAETQHAAPEW
jgi:hypothetical protein